MRWLKKQYRNLSSLATSLIAVDSYFTFYVMNDFENATFFRHYMQLNKYLCKNKKIRTLTISGFILGSL